MWNKLKFNVVKKFSLFLVISLLLTVIGFAGVTALPFGVNIFNTDIDFIGGTNMHYDLRTPINSEVISSVNEVVQEVTGAPASSIQKTGDSNTEVIVKTKDIPADQRESIFNKLKDKYSLTDDDLLLVDNVSPIVGKDLQRAAILSAVVASALMLLYITIRFDFRSGISAVICLLHDLLVMISAYVIFQIPLNLTFVAAALTILGYSINASIIVFDRIRENSKRMGRRGFDEIVNESIWQTVARTVNTTITTLFTILLLCIFGVSSIRNFAVPIAIGIVSGAYSSIFLAGSFWALFRRKTQKTKARA